MDKLNHVAFFLPLLSGGGAEKVTLNIIKGLLEKGLQVDLVLAQAKGPLLKRVPEKCNLVDLSSGRTILSLFRLVKYLKKNRPSFLISALNHANIVAILSRIIACVPTKTIVAVHSVFLESKDKRENQRSKFIPFFMKLTFSKADAVIAVSNGVANDLSRKLYLPVESIFVLYSPVVNQDLLNKADESVEKDWFGDDSYPVILSVGRLSDVKDYPTLIEAFAILRKKNKCRLVILGEGKERDNLEALARNLGIENDLWMPGFVDNPYKYMKRASVFVLSSKREALPTVLIEAMACGTPVVATKSRGGIAEILENGRYGPLSEVGNAKALADSIQKVLDNPPPAEKMLERASYFSFENAISQYLSLLENLSGESKNRQTFTSKKGEI